MYLNLESSLEHPWSFRPETEVLSRGEASTRPKGVTLDFTDGNSDSGMSDTSSRSAVPGRIDQGHTVAALYKANLDTAAEVGMTQEEINERPSDFVPQKGEVTCLVPEDLYREILINASPNVLALTLGRMIF